MLVYLSLNFDSYSECFDTIDDNPCITLSDIISLFPTFDFQIMVKIAIFTVFDGQMSQRGKWKREPIWLFWRLRWNQEDVY